MKKDSRKLKKIKKFLLPASVLVLTLLVLAFVLIAHKPARYAPLKISDSNQISPYLTKQLMPRIYNSAQMGEPFEVVLTQDGLNDIVARLPQPIQLNNILLTGPQVILLPRQLILMTTIKMRPFDLFASIELNPSTDNRSLLNLHVSNVSLGAVNVTPIALSIGNKAFTNWLESTGNDANDIVAKVCLSLLNDEPFEPIFEVGGSTLKILSITMADKKMTIQMAPVPEQAVHVSRKP